MINMLRTLSLVLSSALVVLGDETGNIARIRFQDLKNTLSGTAGADLIHALSTDGIIAITDVPGLLESRKIALNGAADCLSGPNFSVGGPFGLTTLSDGSVRRSVAADITGIE
jgi:hypothetical protein